MVSDIFEAISWSFDFLKKSLRTNLRTKKPTNGGTMNKQLITGVVLALSVALLSACGGGGGTSTGTSTPGGGSGTIVYGPYETVFGAACQGAEPTPGCTFLRNSDSRITVSVDPHYDRYGYASDDLWFVKFDGSGGASVYDDLGKFQYTATISQFAGHISGTTIGVGTTGTYWENVSNKTYWLGKNGVLYSANQTASNFGQAINNKDAKNATDVNSKALNSEVNKKLIRAGADKLVKQYGLSASKAVAVASALNSWAVMGAERGKVTTADMDKTFKTVFGVKFNEALAAFKDFQSGDVSGARELTNRSATALGLKPDQAQEFIKGMYKSSLQKMGYSAANVDALKW